MQPTWPNGNLRRDFKRMKSNPRILDDFRNGACLAIISYSMETFASNRRSENPSKRTIELIVS